MSKRVFDLRGYKNAPITNVRVKNCSFDNVSDSNIIENVTGMKLENVEVNGKSLPGIG